MSRLRGVLWLLAGLIVAFLAAVVAYITLSRAAQVSGGQVVVEGDKRSVVIVTQRVPVRTLLTSDTLSTVELPVESVPDDAATDIDEVEGKLTLVEMFPGEVVLTPRLVDPNVISGDGRVAVALADDQVLMAVPATDLMSTVAVLKPGDTVDILLSAKFPLSAVTTTSSGATSAGPETQASSSGQGDNLVTFILLQNVTIAALPGTAPTNAQEASEQTTNQSAGKPQALLVTLSPQDALVLKYALDAGGIQDIVLRAPGADQEWDTEPVDQKYIIDAYEIPGE